jgi:small nuclear ribonucleoprotein (snRNP)-like protein
MRRRPHRQSRPSCSRPSTPCHPGAPARRTRAPVVPRRAAPLLSRAEDTRRRAPSRPCCSAPGCPVHASLRRLTVPRPQQCLDPPAPVAMSFTSPAALVTVCVLLHDGQLIRGMFVSFDPVWNPILRDCVEVHPQAGHHVPGPLVFPRVVIASLAVEPVSSPSLPSASVGAPSLALSAHTVPSPLPPPRSTTDWVVDSGASFHTTPPLIPYSTPIHPPLTSDLHRRQQRFHPPGHLSRYIGSSRTILP